MNFCIRILLHKQLSTTIVPVNNTTMATCKSVRKAIIVIHHCKQKRTRQTDKVSLILMMTGLESFRSLQVVTLHWTTCMWTQVTGQWLHFTHWFIIHVLSEFIQWYMKVAFFSYSLDCQIIEAFQGTNVETFWCRCHFHGIG